MEGFCGGRNGALNSCFPQEVGGFAPERGGKFDEGVDGDVLFSTLYLSNVVAVDMNPRGQPAADSIRSLADSGRFMRFRQRGRRT